MNFKSPFLVTVLSLALLFPVVAGAQPDNSLDTDIGFYLDQQQGQFLWDDFRGYLLDAEFPPEVADLEKLSRLIQTIEGFSFLNVA